MKGGAWLVLAVPALMGLGLTIGAIASRRHMSTAVVVALTVPSRPVRRAAMPRESRMPDTALLPSTVTVGPVTVTRGVVAVPSTNCLWVPA